MDRAVAVGYASGVEVRQLPSSASTGLAEDRWRDRQRRAFVALAPFLLLGLLPLLFWIARLIDLEQRGALVYDFHQFFYPQARDVLEGRQPATAYPPLTTLLYLPFATLPRVWADASVTAFMLACFGATLAALGVRDWRVFGAAALWPSVTSAVQTGNLSLVLAVGVALVWRWRERPFAVGALVAVMVALKLFLWPLAIWLLAMRRFRAVGVMVAFGVAVSAAAWAVVGFDSLTQMPALLRGNVEANGTWPYTVVALLGELGAAGWLAYGVCWAVGAAVAAAAVRQARGGRDAEALSLAIGVALLVSPIVWSHYLVLLLVPVALARPRFSWLWLAPLPLWVCPPVDGSLFQKLVLLAGMAAIVAYTGGLRPAGGRLPWRPAPVQRA